MTQTLNGRAHDLVRQDLDRRPDAGISEVVGVPNRVRWRRGSGRPTNGRRAVGLARFAVGTGLDAELHGFDATVRSAVEQRAQRTVDSSARRNRRRARRCDALADRAQAARERAAQHGSDALVADPLLGVTSATELAAQHARTARSIDALIESGDDRHRRVGRGARLVARLLPWLDALLFGYFVAGVSNADLSAPWTTPLASAVAAGLTLLVVLVVAAFTPWLGRRLRVVKSRTGEPDWARLGPSSIGLLGLWAVLAVAMGVTMFVRVWHEAGYAGADGTTAVVVSGLLALSAVTLNVYVLGVAYADGSAAADDLHARSRTLARLARRQRRWQRQAERLARRRARIARRAEATESTALAHVARRLRHGEHLIGLGRLRTGTRRPPTPAAPTAQRIDLTALARSRRSG